MNKRKDQTAYVKVSHLSKTYDISEPFYSRLLTGKKKVMLHAVNDVSFQIAKGETYALVGESGSGKSTLARSLVGLEQPNKGFISFDGSVVFDENKGQMLDGFMRQKLQMVFQSPYSSLNPRWRIRDILAEPIKAFNLIEGEEDQYRRVNELLEMVGLSKSDSDRS